MRRSLPARFVAFLAFVVAFLAADRAWAEAPPWPAGSAKWELYKSDPTYEHDGKVTVQRSDGKFDVQTQTGKDAKVPELNPKINANLYADGVSGRADVWSGTAQSDAGDKVTLSTLGADGKAGYEVGVGNGKVRLAGEISGKAYLVRLEAETRKGELGDETLGVTIQAKGDAFVGGEAGAKGEFKFDKSGILTEVKAEAFLGGKAEGEIPLTVSLCYMKGSGKVKGQVSYGIGGEVRGTFEIDWVNMKATLSGELAATLGLGAGADAEVSVDLSALVKDPGKVAECLLEKLKDLGEAALQAGTDLVVATAQVASDVGDALVDAGDAAVDALASGLDTAKDAVSSLTNSFLGGLGSLLGGRPCRVGPCR